MIGLWSDSHDEMMRFWAGITYIPLFCRPEVLNPFTTPNGGVFNKCHILKMGAGPYMCFQVCYTTKRNWNVTLCIRAPVPS